MGSIVRVALLSPKLIVFGSSDYTIRIWDMEIVTCRKTMNPTPLHAPGAATKRNFKAKGLVEIFETSTTRLSVGYATEYSIHS